MTVVTKTPDFFFNFEQVVMWLSKDIMKPCSQGQESITTIGEIDGSKSLESG